MLNYQRVWDVSILIIFEKTPVVSVVHLFNQHIGARKFSPCDESAENGKWGEQRVQVQETGEEPWLAGIFRVSHMLHGAGIFPYKTGWFLGQMLVNIPYTWSIWVLESSRTGSNRDCFFFRQPMVVFCPRKIHSGGVL